METTAGADAKATAEQCLDNSYGEIAIVNNEADAIDADESTETSDSGATKN